MKKWIPILIILAAAGGGGYYYYTATGVPEKPQVTQVAVSQGNIVEVVQATGTIEALRVAPVGSQVSGIVKALYADFNSIVRKDQIIAELDPSLLQVQVDLQRANLERQNGEIAIQEVQLEDAKKQLERTQSLFEKGLANQQSLDAAILTVKSRTTSLDAARKQLLTVQANLRQAELNVSYCTIRSPIDGVVVNRFVDIGQSVQASLQSPQFFTLATDLKTLKLNAPVDEAEIGKVRRGMPVTFTVDTFQGRTFNGTVDTVRLNASNQNNVVTYPVWIEVDNSDYSLRPALTANVRIRIAEAPNAIRIPNIALRFRPTSDMYTALGLTPPAAGRGNPNAVEGRRGGRGGDGQGGETRGGQQPAGQTAQAGQQQGAQRPAATGGGQEGQQRQRGGGQGGNRAVGQGQGQGFGGQGGGGGRGQFANLSPEERQRMMEQFGGGRRGQGAVGQAGGGRGGQGGGRGGGRGIPQTTSLAPQTSTEALQMDDLFQPPPSRVAGGQVYTWDEANKKLTQINITVGLRDDQFSQLVSGDLKPGQQLVSGIIIPLTTAQRNQQNSLFGNQGRGGFGMQPGRPGGDGGGQQPRGGGNSGDGFGGASGRGGGGGRGGD